MNRLRCSCSNYLIGQINFMYNYSKRYPAINQRVSVSPI